MTAQHFTHNRRGRGRGNGGFATRYEGANLAKKIWICHACFAWNDARPDEWGGKPTKPAECIGCQGTDFLYFDSRGEAMRFVQLTRDQQHGQIRSLVHHPRYPLNVLTHTGKPAVFTRYEADSYYEKPLDDTWIPVVEDFKPKDPKAQDPVFKLKRKAFELQYGIPITIVS